MRISGTSEDDDLLAEAVAHASLVGLPVRLHVGGIAPQQVIQQAVVGHVRRSGNLADVVHVRQRRRQPTVHAEDLARDDRGDGEGVEGVDEALPDLDVAPSFALVVEAIHARHVGALVIAAEQKEVLGELELVTEQQQDRLETLLASIDVVAEEEVVGVGREAAHLEHADQIGVLAVHVADDLDRGRELHQRRLGQEDLARGGTDGRDLGVLQADGLGYLASVARVQQTADHVVEIDRSERADAHGGRPTGGRVRSGEHGWRAGGFGPDDALLLEQDGLFGLLRVGRIDGTGRRSIRDVIDLSALLGLSHALVPPTERGRLAGRRGKFDGIRQHGAVAHTRIGRRSVQCGARVGPLWLDAIRLGAGAGAGRRSDRHRVGFVWRPDAAGWGAGERGGRGTWALGARASWNLGADGASKGARRVPRVRFAEGRIRFEALCGRSPQAV